MLIGLVRHCLGTVRCAASVDHRHGFGGACAASGTGSGCRPVGGASSVCTPVWMAEASTAQAQLPGWSGVSRYQGSRFDSRRTWARGGRARCEGRPPAGALSGRLSRPWPVRQRPGHTYRAAARPQPGLWLAVAVGQVLPFVEAMPRCPSPAEPCAPARTAWAPWLSPVTAWICGPQTPHTSSTVPRSAVASPPAARAGRPAVTQQEPPGLPPDAQPVHVASGVWCAHARVGHGASNAPLEPLHGATPTRAGL